MDTGLVNSISIILVALTVVLVVAITTALSIRVAKLEQRLAAIESEGE